MLPNVNLTVVYMINDFAVLNVYCFTRLITYKMSELFIVSLFTNDAKFLL